MTDRQTAIHNAKQALRLNMTNGIMNHQLELLKDGDWAWFDVNGWWIQLAPSGALHRAINAANETEVINERALA